ncbi:MAG TPA: NADP-dependent oxidoreductase [Candidatus Saccharimonadales bacterium]|nr:NADP-dependent oxidoreductase [Candidatus Saccharimonadales bacterium]
MRAAQINSYGDKDVLHFTDQAPKPTAGPGQVLVEVHAASVNPYDWMVMSGIGGANLTFPATLGGDLAGVVAEVGPDVEGFEVGQEVYGGANPASGRGSFAEFAPAKATSIAPKPANIDFVTAAALPLAAESAYQALVDTLHLSAGQKILIHGGAGGIGTIAIQLAKHLGAYVATTVSEKNKDYAVQLGADEVIDYKVERFEEKLQDFDAVFDTVGGDTYERSFAVLKKGGQIVSMVAPPNEELAAAHDVTAIHQFTDATTERLAHITELVEQGVLNVTIDQTYPLEQAAEALDQLHNGGHRGKIVIKIK